MSDRIRREERERIAEQFDAIRKDYERQVVDDYGLDSITAAILVGAFSRAAHIARQEATP